MGGWDTLASRRCPPPLPSGAAPYVCRCAARGEARFGTTLTRGLRALLATEAGGRSRSGCEARSLFPPAFISVQLVCVVFYPQSPNDRIYPPVIRCFLSGGRDALAPTRLHPPPRGERGWVCAYQVDRFSARSEAQLGTTLLLRACGCEARVFLPKPKGHRKRWLRVAGMKFSFTSLSQIHPHRTVLKFKFMERCYLRRNYDSIKLRFGMACGVIGVMLAARCEAAR